MLNKDTGPMSVTVLGWQSETPDVALTTLYRSIQMISKKMPELTSCKKKTPVKLLVVAT